MQIKTKRRYLTYTQERLQSKWGTLPSIGKFVRKQKTPFITGKNAKCYCYFGKEFSSFLKVKHILKHSNSTHILLTQKKENICPHRKTCSQMFTAALFKATKNWKQFKSLSNGEKIKNMTYWDITVLLSNTKELTTDKCNDVDEFWKHPGKRKNSDRKHCICMTPFL